MQVDVNSPPPAFEDSKFKQKDGEDYDEFHRSVAQGNALIAGVEDEIARAQSVNVELENVDKFKSTLSAEDVEAVKAQVGGSSSSTAAPGVKVLPKQKDPLERASYLTGTRKIEVDPR